MIFCYFDDEDVKSGKALREFENNVNDIMVKLGGNPIDVRSDEHPAPPITESVEDEDVKSWIDSFIRGKFTVDEEIRQVEHTKNSVPEEQRLEHGVSDEKLDTYLAWLYDYKDFIETLEEEDIEG